MSNYTCRICNSPYKEEVEKMLLSKLRYRDIAKRHESLFDCDLHLLEQSVAFHKKHIPKDLTLEEKQLLERLEKGEVSTDEVSRVVAVKVFEKMLKNPDDFRFIDFFRTELLKIKQQETQTKEKWGNELLARMFSGKLPEPNCPNCGTRFIEYSNSERLTS